MRTTVTKTWSFPEGTASAVTKRAEELGVAESTVVRWAIEKYLNMRTVDVSIARQTRAKPRKRKQS